MNKAILTNAEGLEEYGLKDGMEGEITGTTTVAGQKIVFFRPKDEYKIYGVKKERVQEESK